jgi:hypothetical protein
MLISLALPLPVKKKKSIIIDPIKSGSNRIKKFFDPLSFIIRDSITNNKKAAGKISGINIKNTKPLKSKIKYSFKALKSEFVISILKGMCDLTIINILYNFLENRTKKPT